MTDRFVFVIAPYVLGAAAVPACVARYMLSTRRGWPVVADRPTGGHVRVRSMWRWAIGIVAALHVAGFGFPEHILQWNHHPFRLLLLESVGLTAGAAALVALIALAARHTRATLARRSPSDVVAWTLVMIELVSGLALAIAFRWASSWSAVTVTPYLQSLLRFDPATPLVGRLPLVARVHIFAAFAALVVLPMTTSAQAFFRPLEMVLQWMGGHGSSARAASHRALESASARLQPLRVLVLPSDGEEN